MRNLHSVVIADDVGGPAANYTDDDLTVTAKVFIGVTSPIWIPLSLVAVVIGTPIVGIFVLREKMQDKKKLKIYQQDRCAFLTKVSPEYLDSVNNEVVLREFVDEQLREAK